MKNNPFRMFIVCFGFSLCLTAPVFLGIAGESPKAELPAKKNRGRTFDLGKGVKLELVAIEAGSFIMGDDRGDAEEQPAHKVTIGKPFYLGKFEVTQEQWEAVLDVNPSRFKDAKLPVDRVSFEDCRAFVEKLNAQFAGAEVSFGIPSEAEWEYACRAGDTGQFCFGGDEKKLGDFGWFEDNAAGRTHPVGEKNPNAWGLYDMHGNVWEWTADWYDDAYYRESPELNPTGPKNGVSRVLRGGSWSDPAIYCRPAYRFCLPPWFRVHCYGLRVICRETGNR
jgi:formylglycine-generating enzyme required for sulfatase activity